MIEEAVLVLSLRGGCSSRRSNLPLTGDCFAALAMTGENGGMTREPVSLERCQVVYVVFLFFVNQ